MRAPGSASQLQPASPHYGWEASRVAQLVCASSPTTPAMEQQRKNTFQARWQKDNYKSMFIVYIHWCCPLVFLHHTRKLILPLHFVSTSLPLFYVIISPSQFLLTNTHDSRPRLQPQDPPYMIYLPHLHLSCSHLLKYLQLYSQPLWFMLPLSPTTPSTPPLSPSPRPTTPLSRDNLKLRQQLFISIYEIKQWWH